MDSKKLQQMRKKRGLSQQQLADKSGVHRTYIAQIETGKKNPTVAILERLAVALDCSIRNFF